MLKKNPKQVTEDISVPLAAIWDAWYLKMKGGKKKTIPLIFHILNKLLRYAFGRQEERESWPPQIQESKLSCQFNFLL